MDDNTINIKQLAVEVADEFSIVIREDDLYFSEQTTEEMMNYVEEQVGNITPVGHIIKDGCLSHLMDELTVHVKLEIEKRINTMVSSFTKDEKKLIHDDVFKIEVEKDGY